MSNLKADQYRSVAGRFDKTLLAKVNRSSGSQELELKKLISKQNQPRKYFDERELAALAESIKNEGIKNALHVRRVADESYEILAGERRYRAACLLGLERVPVIIHDTNDTEADKIAILDNLHRADLNPIEETEAIVLLVQNALSIQREMAVNKLRAAANIAKGRQQDEITDGELETIHLLFDRYVGRLTILSFAQARLPLLKLPPEVYEAILQGKIAYTVAVPLKDVEDNEKRIKSLKQAIDHKLTRQQVQHMVKEIKQQPVSIRNLETQVKPARNFFSISNLRRIPEEKRGDFLLLTEEFITRAKKLLGD